MIVSENNVSDALTYLADDPHPLARARKEITDAENKAKRLYARAFMDAQGSVEARKSAAETDDEYVIAKDDEAEAIFQLERHKARVKAAEMILEIWRTEQANIRATERIR